MSAAAVLWRAWEHDPPSRDEGLEMWRTFACVYAWFLALQLLDVLGTFAVLTLGGLESNPVGAGAWARDGADGLARLKLILVALTLATWIPALAYLAHPKRRSRKAIVAVFALMTALVVYYSAVVFWNLANLAVLVQAVGAT